MAKIPVRFKRIAAAFDEGAKARLCESSGSEHSPLPESFTDLSHLVNCFIEKDGVVVDGKINKEEDYEDEENDGEMGSHWCDSEKTDKLRSLLVGRDGDSATDDDDERRICEETESACRLIGDRSSQGFKRRLMSHLREKGFDAGLCKSRWEKNVKYPAGNYEFVDVNVGANRYIIEVNLAAQFEIARPTDAYMSLLSLFPPVFVGKPGVLKQILRLICSAARQSIKRAELTLPPWRRNGYMQAKWFGSYKRTTSTLPNTLQFSEEQTAAKPTNRSTGFVTLQVRSYNCRDVVSGRAAFKIGQLTAAFGDGDGDGDMGN